MTHLSNPLVTVSQLIQGASLNNEIPQELQESIRFYTARLTQAAGILLRLSQDITAQANVLLFRYWAEVGLMKNEFSEVSAAVIYLTAKVSASPRALRGITNVYAYLLSSNSVLSLPQLETSSLPKPDPKCYYLSESTYVAKRTRIIHLEGQILNALGFHTHVALPHTLAITYLQILDVFESVNKNIGHNVAQRTIAHLNSALLNPQTLYLTHQPCQLATAAIFVAAREIGVALPSCAWWEVFDCEREDLGFLAVALGSLEPLVEREVSRWGEEKGMISRNDIFNEIKKLGFNHSAHKKNNKEGEDEGVVDEETEMAKLLDIKVDSLSKSKH